MPLTPLPIDQTLPRLVQELRQHRAAVLVAPPGAGKTTRVPPAILEAGLLDNEHPRLVVLQPRRVAARATAQRIADEQGWTLGEQVGYHVRFEKKLSPRTPLRVLTEGILTRQLLDDPFLEDVGAVLLDEFHERSLHSDLALALLQEVRQTVRPDLLLLVMSATLEADPAAKFLGGCPIVRAEGRTFPIEVSYRPPAYGQAPAEAAASAVIALLADTTNSALARDILVFLPGAGEIRRAADLLSVAARRHDLLIAPLYGALPFAEQLRAIQPSARRKIILATNIAETSLTIDGVGTVIDSGLARVARFDEVRGLDRLDLERISDASATQRAGRAGRTGPGYAIRLWSAKEQAALAPFDTPEVHRVDLCPTVLTLHAWGKSDPAGFAWYEAPAAEKLASAERLLRMLGAIEGDDRGAISPLGKRLAAAPVHPRLARLLVAASEAGLADDGATLAAVLSEKDFLLAGYQPNVQADSDVLWRLDLLRQAERERFGVHLAARGVDLAAARQIVRVRDDLLRIARQLGPSLRAAPSADRSTLLKLILLAYPDRVCRRQPGDPRAATMVGGGGVRLGTQSALWQQEYFVALDARHDPRNFRAQATVSVASGIEPGWLEELFPEQVRRERRAVYDPDRRRVIGLAQVWYHDLLLREDPGANINPDEAAAALAEALTPQAREIFLANPAAANVLARIDMLRRHMPERPWPGFDDADLARLLVQAIGGKRSLDQIEQAPLAQLLIAELPYPLDRLLEQHAPTSLTVPSGSQIRLEYTAGERPVLAVRLQELFGWHDTPRIAGGRVPVVLHLLGPNYRPVQITDDLRSFWSVTYFQVRKDLRVRYPKHSWPEDPLSATPQAKGGRRRG